MYKVDIKTLSEIIKALDDLTAENGVLNFKEYMEATKRAKKLSQKIKDTYTEIKP
jgi:hypothetical protein